MSTAAGTITATLAVLLCVDTCACTRASAPFTSAPMSHFFFVWQPFPNKDARSILLKWRLALVVPQHKYGEDSREDDLEIDKEINCMLEVIVLAHLVLVNHLLRVISNVR